MVHALVQALHMHAPHQDLNHHLHSPLFRVRVVLGYRVCACHMVPSYQACSMMQVLHIQTLHRDLHPHPSTSCQDKAMSRMSGPGIPHSA